MSKPLDRDELKHCLSSLYEPLSWCDALWEGGSAAFGRADSYSDVDLSLQVEPGRRDEAIALADEALAALSRVELRWRVPEPAWHGHSQCFWRLADAGEYLLVDLAVMERGSAERFLERERHGDAVPLFDKGDWVVAEPLDEVELAASLRAKVETLRVVFPLFQCLAKKEVARGRFLEAAAAWHGHVLRPLVTLLRIRWSPARHDFGFRLIHEDLPAAVVEELRPLAWPAGPESLEKLLPAAEALFDRTLRSLELDR
jgi:hypothetical protein